MKPDLGGWDVCAWMSSDIVPFGVNIFLNRPKIFFDFLISFFDRLGCWGSRTLSMGGWQWETKPWGRSESLKYKSEFPVLKGMEDVPPPCRCCTPDVDDTIIETFEEALNLDMSICDGCNKREALCLGVEETEGKVLGIASSEAHEESSDNDSDSDSEIIAGWEIVGSKDKVQLFLPSGCDKRSEFG